MLVFITFPHLNTTPFKDTIHLMFVGLKSHGCKQKGHIIRACKKRKYTAVPQQGAAHYVKDCSEETTYTTHEGDNTLGIYSALKHSNETHPFVVSFSLEGIDCKMHVDTCATVSLVSKAFYKERFSHVPLENTDIELKAYAGHKLPVCGQINVSVSYQAQTGVGDLVKRPRIPTAGGKFTL